MLHLLLEQVLEQVANSTDPEDEQLLARLESRAHTQDDIRTLVRRIERLAQLTPTFTSNKKILS